LTNISNHADVLELPQTTRPTRPRFPRLIGTETKTIIQPLVRTFGVDADPFGHLIDQPYTHQPSLFISNHADVLELPQTSRPSRFPRLIGTETKTFIQPLVRTFGVDADPFGHLIDQPYTHQPSLFISNHADVHMKPQ
jgi:hypothetical protein